MADRVLFPAKRASAPLGLRAKRCRQEDHLVFYSTQSVRSPPQYQVFILREARGLWQRLCRLFGAGHGVGPGPHSTSMSWELGVSGDQPRRPLGRGTWLGPLGLEPVPGQVSSSTYQPQLPCVWCWACAVFGGLRAGAPGAVLAGPWCAPIQQPQEAGGQGHSERQEPQVGWWTACGWNVDEAPISPSWEAPRPGQPLTLCSCGWGRPVGTTTEAALLGPDRDLRVSPTPAFWCSEKRVCPSVTRRPGKSEASVSQMAPKEAKGKSRPAEHEVGCRMRGRQGQAETAKTR